MANAPTQPLWAVMPDRPLTARDALIQLYWAGVRAVHPAPALKAALDKLPPDALRRRIWVLAIGKAADRMAAGAVEWLADRHVEPAGGIVVSPRPAPAPHASLESVVGDHPVPGASSHQAAMRLAQVVARVRPGDEAWVLLSGGATSLIAAPDTAIKPDELVALYDVLLGSGLDIASMNLIRKRFSRWGAGRLAMALAGARVRNYIISDVIGDDLAAIGSGPCVPDETTGAQIRTLLATAGLWDRIPTGMRRYLQQVERDASLETPKPGDDALAQVERKLIASNRIALDAIVVRARELGYEPRILSTTLAGEAAHVGRRLAQTLLSYCGTAGSTLAGRSGKTCLIWGGETTVTLPQGSTGIGGRCQELALAAAQELAQAKSARGATLLAAGTDGRDGATDAAGAIVDREAWDAARRAGRDPARDLAAHDSHSALDAAQVLLRTDLTSTNVMDVMIGVCEPPDADAAQPRTPRGTLAKISGSFRRITG